MVSHKSWKSKDRNTKILYIDTKQLPQSSQKMHSTVAYLLKERNVEPEEISIARERHSNNTRLGVFYEVHATFPQQQVCMQQ
jgi:hypothetical protein